MKPNDKQSDYLAFEKQYTEWADRAFRTSQGTAHECWREICLASRKEARDLWVRMGGVDPQYHFQDTTAEKFDKWWKDFDTFSTNRVEDLAREAFYAGMRENKLCA